MQSARTAVDWHFRKVPLAALRSFLLQRGGRRVGNCPISQAGSDQGLSRRATTAGMERGEDMEAKWTGFGRCI